MFPADFKACSAELSNVEMFYQIGGSGPPLYLLHGFPQTHVAWHRVAPALSERHTVVIPDLRGYGQTSAPETDDQHFPYSKRAMAQDIVELADHLGHARFALAGHDRGARVGYRLVLDHPGRVTRFCSVDVIPTLDVWEQMDAATALAHYHWSFLALPSPVPETLIGHDPRFYFGHLFERWAGDRSGLDARAMAMYLEQYDRPDRIHAQCEDYRAGATCDCALDRLDRTAGRKLTAPVFLLWARGYLGENAVSPRASWEQWANDVRDVPLDCGHFVVEEQPTASAEAMLSFFG